jgi:hypothetical protein
MAWWVGNNFDTIDENAKEGQEELTPGLSGQLRRVVFQPPLPNLEEEQSYGAVTGPSEGKATFCRFGITGKQVGGFLGHGDEAGMSDHAVDGAGAALVN